jgi:hypothetical protein
MIHDFIGPPNVFLVSFAAERALRAGRIVAEEGRWEWGRGWEEGAINRTAARIKTG